MAYLTFEEFRDLNLSNELTEDEFNKLLAPASLLLDTQTNDFYVFNDLDKDVPYRSKRFKQALAAQIQYFKETGKTTNYGLNKTPQSFSAGRTSVSMGSTQSTTSIDTPLMADEAYLYLEGTGLLYRGVQ